SPFGDADLEDDIFSSGPFRADDPPMSASPAKATVPPAERAARRRARGEARRAQAPTAQPGPTSAVAVEPMFPGIPAEIAPTRLPGTVERAPVITTLLIALLVIANLALA